MAIGESLLKWTGLIGASGDKPKQKDDLRRLRKDVAEQLRRLESQLAKIDDRLAEIEERQLDSLDPGRGLRASRIPQLDDIEAFLRTNHTRLDAPVVLISQAQRSGGTLLSELLDSHPAIASHPNELAFANQTEESWPTLDPELGPEKNFDLLFQSRPKLIELGYVKGDQGEDAYPFFLIPQAQFQLFQHLFETTSPATARQVFDLYFTSLFNAWLNRQGSLEAKDWIVAFAPRLANDEASVERFFECYPDGLLIQILRDPTTWYPSARGHRRSKKLGLASEELLDIWCASSEAIKRNAQRHGDRVIVLKFEDLVARTEPVMRDLAERLGISFEPTLLAPTFNGAPIRANSSFPVDASGVIAGPLARKSNLSREEEDAIERRCRALYEDALGSVTLR